MNSRFLALGAGLTLLCGLAHADNPKHLTPEQKAKYTPKILFDRDTAHLDLFWGIGSRAHQPKPDKDDVYDFVEEDFNQTSPKLIVKDSTGRKWKVKFSTGQFSKTQSEVASTRLQYGCGFHVAREVYHVWTGKIRGFEPGQSDPKTGKFSRVGADLLEKDETTFAKRYIFHDVSFTAKGGKGDEKALDEDNWNFSDPTVKGYGTREWSALKIFTVMIADWDTKPANQATLYMPNGQAYVTNKDPGSAFGRMDAAGIGKLIAPLRVANWDLGAYSHAKFVEFPNGKPAKIAGDMLHMHYRNNYDQKAVNAKELSSVPLADAKWYYETVLSKLSLAQVSEAFRAADASKEDAQKFAQAFMRRIDEIAIAVGDK